MIPLISTLCQGPLGVGQLPRLWWKVLLHHHGLIDEEYPAFTRVLDLHVVQTLRLDEEKTLAYLRRESPDYLTFEAWVLEESGGNLHRPTIERWNHALEGRTHLAPAKFAEVYPDIGFDEGATIASAVLLNCLQDWQLFHRNYLSRPDRLRRPVVPLISSIDRGPLGVCQLPRTWLKVSLDVLGVLHPDYPACGGGLDARVLAALGVDRDRAVGFIREQRPHYLAFETWIRDETGGGPDPAAVEAFNHALLTREHGPEKCSGIMRTLGIDRPWTGGVLLNHLEDWKLAHQMLPASA
ncbi:MAG: hypothetical protein EA425_12745 [Puniceicoccaceae bacterium]|nr:MAG: hypothetical protein EA425_12745 [Puniceicoccaceae bacterium]